jgi:hypothetical protein
MGSGIIEEVFRKEENCPSMIIQRRTEDQRGSSTLAAAKLQIVEKAHIVWS